MSNYLMSDFVISDEAVPVVVMDRIQKYHLEVLDPVQDNTPFKVYPSADSCFRTYWWEIARGRSGGSQHTFGQRRFKILNQIGACDITCENFAQNEEELLKALIKHTPYIRFAVYNTFIHADYKDTHNGKRLLFNSTSSSKWTFVKFI